LGWLGVVGFLGLGVSVVRGGDSGPYRYAIQRVAGLGGSDDFGWGVNDLGHVVGDGITPNGVELQAFFWDGRTAMQLQTFGGTLSHAFDINNKDWVVGSTRDADEAAYAVVWRNGGLEDLGNLGAQSAVANGINEKGQIVGLSSTITNPFGEAFIWENGVMTDLGTLPGGLASQAFDINENGLVTGRSDDDSEVSWRGFLWDAQRGMIDIGSLGDGEQRTEPQAINDLGVIVGDSDVNSFHDHRPMLYLNGRKVNAMIPLKGTGVFAGGFFDINNSNQAVGYLFHRKLVNYQSLAGYWDMDSGWANLNDVIPPKVGWFLIVATAINEGGQVLTWGVPNNDPEENRTFLLTPIDPEMVLSIDGGAIIAGQVNSFSVSGAVAGAVVKFYYGLRGGGTRLPGCGALAAMLQIDEPRLFGSVVVDGNGDGQLDVMVPSGASGMSGILIQAVDFGNCQESELVVEDVE